MLTQKEISTGLRSLGIARGDVLHVHSSMRHMGPVDGKFEAVIRAFRDVIGNEGILSVPTHSWSIVTDKQPVFHQLHTPSNVGAFANYFLKHPDAVRSIQPSHSVSAIGDRAPEFVAGHELTTTACSPEGPYGKLIKLHGKIVLLGVNLTRCTFFHCLEEIAGCGEIWSLQKEPGKRYMITADGSELSINYRGHINPVSDQYHRIEYDMLAEKIMVQNFIGPCPVKVLDARKAADWLVPKLKDNPHFFW
jgi:aminoglycoside 3-N-acetyltransferase